MANYLKMAKISTIQQLRKRGWSKRRIARELGVDRGTVDKYLASRGQGSKPATNAPIGSDSKPATKAPIGSGQDYRRRHGPPSRCEPFRELIQAKVARGLSAQRIYQDLVTEEGFTNRYHSVRRFVGRLLRTDQAIAFRRMESAPGEEAQVDFGAAAPIVGADGRRRKTYAFRMVLSCSRKAYSEVVTRQTTEVFIRCLENAFWHFGGVPRTLIVDNLKAAVIRADWYDPEINPKVQSFCKHYGTVILPAKPYTPRHKGKVERSVGYLKDNALKNRRFPSVAEQNKYLLHWERHVADQRIHGTIRKQVRKVFEEIEKPALLPLPISYFASFNEAQRSVHRDGYVEVDKSYYSVPPEYVGHRVWVRWDSRVVRIFNLRLEQIILHAKTEPGRFQTHPEHIHERKRCGIERGANWLLEKAYRIGGNAEQWGQALLTNRGVEGTRTLMGLLSLTKHYSHRQIDRACQIALSHEAFRLRTIRQILKRGGGPQQTFEFIDEHPLIRNLSDYQEVLDMNVGS